MPWAALQSRLNTAALAVFGEAVRVADVELRGDFHEPDEEMRFEDISGIAKVPRLILRSEDVPENPVGQSVEARDRLFSIADARHDGRGMCLLELERA